jgi:hypothetical protein
LYVLPAGLAGIPSKNEVGVANTLSDTAPLAGEIGFFGVLHSWNQKLDHYPHLHCVIPAGGLSPDHQRWIPSRYRFFLPVKVRRRTPPAFVPLPREPRLAPHSDFNQIVCPGIPENIRYTAAVRIFNAHKVEMGRF